MNEPVKNYRNKKYPEGDVTQWFAESPDLYRGLCISGGYCHPSMTCPAGTGCLIGHNGIDIVRPWGEPMFAVKDALVVEVKDNPGGYGRHIRILTDPNKDGICEEWTYGHCSVNLVKVGDRVKAGQTIALMGNTGFVVSGATPYWKYNPYAGTHLHLGKRLMRVSKNGWRYYHGAPKLEVVDYENGYFGSVDFRDELPDYSGPDTAKLLLTIQSLVNLLRLRGIIK